MQTNIIGSERFIVGITAKGTLWQAGAGAVVAGFNAV